MVRALNDGGEAQSIANFVFVDNSQIDNSTMQIDIQHKVSIYKINIFKLGFNW